MLDILDTPLQDKPKSSIFAALVKGMEDTIKSLVEIIEVLEGFLLLILFALLVVGCSLTDG